MRTVERPAPGMASTGFVVCVLALALAAVLWINTKNFQDGCITLENRLTICAASELAKHHQTQSLKTDHANFDLKDKRIKLEAARNESIAFQLIVQSSIASKIAPISVEHAEWKINNSEHALNPTSTPSTLAHLAHYHYVDKGGYQWGPASRVLKWPAAYPDALVPQTKQCGNKHDTLFEQFDAPKYKHNQALWLETYVPANTVPGVYEQKINISSGEHSVELTAELTIHNATLPQHTTIAAIGEVYRSYKLEGAGSDPTTERWRDMSYCYQQLAHQHRMVFIERYDDQPLNSAWRNYQSVVTPLLDGTLFSDAYHYTGTGKNVPVSTWRTPWPQQFDVTLKEPLANDVLERYTHMAREWDLWVQENNFTDTDFFAYVFDELDGPNKSGQRPAAYRKYIAMVHEQMGAVQQALDKGTRHSTLDLLWTSHSNPAQWQADEALDLTNKVRLWAPNASAADVPFLQERMAAGEKAWFYHSGHPAIGIHSINASGIEMRTWGVAAARYGFQGQLMWAVNLGNDELPFAQPSYKPDDDRFGNGVMVYPGNQLDKIGFKKSPGPISSMRLKAWRSGLQDAELYYLAHQKAPELAQALLHKIMPAALSEGRKQAAWPNDAASWIAFRKGLLALASE